jgi:hypothetical protein
VVLSPWVVPARFDEAAPPAGFIVVVYRGEPHTFRLTPLGGDGQAFEVV